MTVQKVASDINGNIQLDPAIKSHVLLPIMVIMLLVAIFRQLITAYWRPSAKLQSLSKTRQNENLLRCKLQSNNAWVCACESEWETHKSSIIRAFKSENLHKIKDETSVSSFSAINDTMLDGIKSNLLSYVSQPVMMFYMSFLFKGFIVLKLPFDLTNNFKDMLQTSIMTDDLDVSYVTGISWYFLNLLGIESIGNVIMGDRNGKEIEMLDNFTNVLKSGMGPKQESSGPVTDEMFKQASQGLRMIRYPLALADVEQRFIDRNIKDI